MHPNSIHLLVPPCVPVCHSVWPFVYTSLLANVQGSETLVCFEASDFCYSIHTGTSLRYPVVARSHGDPAALDLQDWLFYVLQQIIYGVELEWANSKPCTGAWETAELVSPLDFLHLYHPGELSTALASLPNVTGPALLSAWASDG